ncbi:MAG: radical SAM protein [Bacteroidales bacterium]|nr:radical SAM protein [Bacteroidales bacterium]
MKNTYEFDYIWFVDDVFTIDKKWLNEFNQELKNENLKIKYECISRADKLDNETIDLLEKTGCYKIWIGAESGSQKILDAMDRRVKIEQVIDAINYCKQKNIETGTFIMFGYPKEKIKDINLTIKYLKKAKPDSVLTTNTYPIIGTDLFNQIKEKIFNFDWENVADADLIFEKPYSNKFYSYANAKLHAEVNLSKLALKKYFSKKGIILIIKSIYYRFKMIKEKYAN